MVGSHGEEIRDRQQMAALLSDRMVGSYESLEAGQRLEPDTSLLGQYWDEEREHPFSRMELAQPYEDVSTLSLVSEGSR